MMRNKKAGDSMRVLVHFFGGILIWWSATAVSAMAPAPNQAAFELVQTTTDELLQRIVAKREIYIQDNQIFFDEIQDLLDPVIDFERIARRVMAKYYKSATVDQREKFVEVFKESLLKIYAKGLLEFDNQKVVVLDPPKNAEKRGDKQKVDIEVRDQGGAIFPISYSMYLDKTNAWKMENVIVNGINIGLTYRNQFSRLMKENKNDIDLVITDWTSKVNSNE